MPLEIDREVWIADGPTVPFLGVFPSPTRMAIVRLHNGDLWVWSPIARDDALAARWRAVGLNRPRRDPARAADRTGGRRPAS